MKNQINQRGRSMIEILGVLAVIGVLSLVALAGYKLAIAKQTANDIVNTVNIYATEMKKAETANALPEGTVLTGKELAPELETHNEYQIEKDTPATFFITVFDVSSGVCRQLIEMKSTVFTDIVANLESTMHCSDMEESNSVSFFFQTVRDGCSICTSMSCLDVDAYCPDSQYCVVGDCRDCQNGQFKDNTGACVSCDANGYVPALDSECNACANRFAHNGSYWTDIRQCSKCSEASSQSFYAQKSDCYRCDNTFAATHPSSGKPVCYGCAETTFSHTRYATLADCTRCPNRYYETATRFCKICPAGTSKDAEGTGCE